MTPDALEQLIADRIRRLPAPQAPPTLRRRVMTAATAARPVVRPWSIWPRVWQTVFALGLTATAAGVSLAWSVVASNAEGDAWWASAARAVVDTTATLGAARDGVALALSWFAALLATPAALAVVALVAGAAFACLVLGVWLTHVAQPPFALSKGASR